MRSAVKTSVDSVPQAILVKILDFNHCLSVAVKAKYNVCTPYKVANLTSNIRAVNC
jgi:hypothetical protein